jgi:RNA polymerase sigma factor (sigma-70 family)
MAGAWVGTLLEFVQRTAQRRENAQASDGALLDQFVTQRDEAAFSALVQRHAPMVWGVCHRLLPSHQDAEDAFQATFLVLALKAASIFPQAMVGNWLHGVAYQTALKARAVAGRRRRTEVQVREMPERVAEQQAGWSDVRALIDDELRRLPERHRAVVVLCDLEGNTRSEAARRLGVPEGTIAGWLSRGRAKLAHRLSRRGLALSGGGLAVALADSAAAGQMPPALASITTQAAVAFAARSGIAAGGISPTVLTVTKGVLESMFFNRFKVLLAFLVIFIVSGVGITVTHFAVAGQDDGKPTTAERPVKASKVDDEAEDLTVKLKGKWVNVDKESYFKRIVIENTDDADKAHQGWTMQWTMLASTGEDVDVEKLKLHLLDETEVSAKQKKPTKPAKKGRVMYGFATWESMERGKKLADYHMTLRMEGELLVVETFKIPTGAFFPQHWRCEYKREM